jgi:hypothetical protein
MYRKSVLLPIGLSSLTDPGYESEAVSRPEHAASKTCGNYMHDYT